MLANNSLLLLMITVCSTEGTRGTTELKVQGDLEFKNKYRNRKICWKHFVPWYFFLSPWGGVRSGCGKWQMLVGSVNGIAVGKEGRSAY